MMRRLLSPLEIEQAMHAERTCKANLLRSERVIVNGMPLSPEEMILLRSYANPPAKLKHGRYWYDKVSGLWGKEGFKPHLFISPHLNIGGPLSKNASNGKEGVSINNRNITKSELWMLKAVMKLYCSFLSLPHPSKSVNPFGESDDEINRTPKFLEERSLQKLLLIGFQGSGTSTILKQ